MSRDPLTEGRIRGGRDDNRTTEDDRARQLLGQQGMPGKTKSKDLSDKQLQNPTPIDPGHTV